MKSTILTTFLFIAAICADAQSLSLGWAKSIAGYNDDAYTVATDKSGNVYIAGGFFDTTLTFGNVTLQNGNPGAQDAYLVKYDSAGNVIWARNESAYSYDAVYGISLDTSGDVYITGTFTGPGVVFGSDTITVTDISDIFLVKYSPVGDVLWAQAAGGVAVGIYENNVQAGGVSVDAAGNAYVMGIYNNDTIAFGTDTLYNIGDQNTFVAKYTSAGNLIWTKNTGITQGQLTGIAIATDANSNYYVTGVFGADSITIGDTTLQNPGINTMFFAKYDSTSATVWVKGMGPYGGSVFPAGISVKGGNVWVTGQFSTPTVDFGNITLTNTGYDEDGQQGFVVKYDTAGNVTWAETTGDNGRSSVVSGTGVSADADGNAYVIGVFQDGYLAFGTDTFTNAGGDILGTDIFMLKYDTAGNLLWKQSAAGTGSDYGTGIATDAFGSVYATGYFESPDLIIDNDTLPLTSNNEIVNNIFIAKFDNIVSGIVAPAQPGELTVYPNPSTSEFYFKGITSGSVIEVYDIVGQRIYSSMVTGDIYLLNISSEAKGIYLYRVVNSDNAVQEGKIVLE